MRPGPLGAAAALIALLLPCAAGAGPVELVAADDRGVTLRLAVPAFELDPPRGDGRRALRVLPLDLLDVPGRPKLPTASAMIAVPPGAKAVASVLDSGEEELHEGVRITIGDRPVFRADPDGVGFTPAREPVAPIEEGAWPPSPVEVGEAFAVRRQGVVVVQLLPFRYDDATGRLWTRRTLTVRVSFVGGRVGPGALAPAAEDRGWESVLQSSVLNYEQGRRWREPRPALSARGLFDRPLFDRARAEGVAGGAAFDETEPEVRVKLGATGAYALDAAELLAQGYPAGVPIDDVSVHRHEYVPAVSAPNPPYATFEVPIEVDDADGDGFFTAGDRVLLYVQSWWARSGLAYRSPVVSHAQRAWGEADFVYVTRVRPPRTGARIPPRNAWIASPPPSLDSYPYTQRWEREQVYFGAPADTLTDAFQWVGTAPLYYSRPDSIRFETYDLDATQLASVGVSWVARIASDVHHVWAAVKNGSGVVTTVVDSAVASGKVTITRSSTIPGTALSEGLNNRFMMWGKNRVGPPDPSTNRLVNVALNYFEATYWRRYRPIQGYLACNSANASGGFEIFAAGFSDSARIRVYDVTDSSSLSRVADARVEIAGNEWAVRIRDSAPGGARRRYVVFDEPLTLPASSYTRVDRAAAANLYNRSEGDYLMVVPEAFRAAMGPLVTLRESQGLDVVVAPLEAVNDVFNGGRTSTWAIKRFIRYAYENWDARFVLLVGDGSVDPLLASRQSSRDWVPTQRILGPVIATGPTESFIEAIVSDPWYVWCVSCNNPALANKVPDLAIGRLPVNSAAEAAAVVSKLVSYENVTPDQTWRRRMVLVSDDLYSGITTFGGGGSQSTAICRRSEERVFQQINERCRSIILDEAGLKQSEPEVFNLSYYLPIGLSDVTPCPQVPDTCRCNPDNFISRAQLYATSSLLSRLNAGRLWWNYQGHANEYVLSHERFYNNSVQYGDDRTKFLNDGRPFLFTAFSCHPNAFGHFQEYGPIRGGPSLGEELVTLPNRGAIASFASSGFELLPSDYTKHINVSLARALFSEPPRDSSAWNPLRGARVVLGEAIAKAELDYFPGPISSPYERDVMISYILLGDPATRITIGSPQALVTANGQPVTDGVPVRLFSFGDTLRLDADLVSNVQLSGLRLERVSAGGTAVIPAADYTVTPPFPDTTAASGGGRRYHVTYRTQLAAGTFTYRFHTVDRYGVPGQFDVVFRFEAVLRAEGGPVRDNDEISPAANLSILLLSPTPIVPGTDLALNLDGGNLNFTAAPANNDLTGREWILSWPAPPYAAGDHRLELLVQGSRAAEFRFSVTNRLQIRNAIAFPNPFNDEGGTAFSFYLAGDRPADVLLRVYTISGRLIFERKQTRLAIGYHQLPWNALDAEGFAIANGVYLYRLVAKNGVSTSVHEGRLIKLRKPRVLADDAAP